MTALIILALLALAAIVATVHDIYTDGLGHAPPPASHPGDPARPTQRP